MRLYFIHIPGCEACEAAKAPLRRWMSRHRDVQLIDVDLLTVGDRWVAPWQARVTPTYVLEVPGRQHVMFEGGLNETDLDKFVAKAQQMMGLR